LNKYSITMTTFYPPPSVQRPVFVRREGNLLILTPDGSTKDPQSAQAQTGPYISFDTRNYVGIMLDGAEIQLSDGRIINGRALPDTGSGGVPNFGNGFFVRVSGTMDGTPFALFGKGSVSGKSTDGGVTIVLAEVITPGELHLKIDCAAPGLLNSSAAYCVTFVNICDEESAPSPPFVVDIPATGKLLLTARYNGYPDGVPIAGMNVYRTYGVSDTYLLVNPEPIPPTGDGDDEYSYTDESAEPQTTTALQSAGWDAPYQDLTALTYIGNGFFVAARSKDVYCSEPYRPHAWPYSMTFPDEVKSIVPVEGGALVTTRDQPYIIYGSHPEHIAQQSINADQAGVSLNSATRIVGTAAYASHDGIIAVSGGAARLDASRGLFTREVWRNLFGQFLQGEAPELHLAEHDGRLTALTVGGHPNVPGYTLHGFMLDLEESSGLTWLLLPGVPLGASVLRNHDALYFGFPEGYREAFAGEYLPLIWHSRDYVYPRHVSFGAAVILCEGEFEVTVYANGEAVHTQTVRSGETAFRLPAAPSQKRWSVKFEGAGVITRFEMGINFAELQNA
jgi:hypothetical protein